MELKMFILKGKYNIAKVMLPDMSNIDEETTKQIYSFLNHPAFQGNPIVIMPDTHAGKGSVIGFTMPLNNYVIPNIVGVDIGCGMNSYNFGKINVNFEKFDEYINNNIPSGYSVRNKVYSKDCNKFIDLLIKVNMDVDRGLKSIGSLGGGNHFIELGVDEEENIWLTIHSGSRNLGLRVAQYHQDIAKNLMNKMFIGSAYKDLEFLPMEDGGNDYLDDMKETQIYAQMNRDVMGDILQNYFNTDYLEKIVSVHNFIDFRDNIIRKGSIRSYEGEKMIIPFNMRDGLIIAEGKSNKEWNYSAPHGAGRILSRKKAKELLDLNTYIEEMKVRGIYTTSLNNNSLDEVAGAYKDTDLILEAIKPTANVLHYVKPVYNFKDH
jgi:RNA-splicing ligase RtcB